MTPINQLFKHDLNQKLAQSERLGATIVEALDLPADAIQHFWPSIHYRKLIIRTNDGIIANQARFMHKALCATVNKNLGLKLTGVDIKLISIPIASPKIATQRQRVSKQTTDVMNKIADSIEDDELNQALKRLARQLKHEP